MNLYEMESEQGIRSLLFLTLSEFVSLFKSEGATVVSEAFNADNITFAMGQVYSKKRNTQLLFKSSQLCSPLIFSLMN